MWSEYISRDTSTLWVTQTSNVQNERTNVLISFWNESKTFWYRSRICLIENRLFRFGPESALLDQIEMISFGKTSSETNTNVLLKPLRLYSLYRSTYSYWNKLFDTVKNKLWTQVKKPIIILVSLKIERYSSPPVTSQKYTKNLSLPHREKEG